MDLDTEINVGDVDHLETNLGDVDDLEEDVYDLEDDLEEDVDDFNELEAITPKVDMEFLSQDDAYDFYNRYALKMGFGIRRSTTYHSRSDHTLIAQIFVCRMQGKKKSLNEDVGSSRRELRVGCKAMMKISRTESNNWKVRLFVSEHINHEMSTPTKVVKHFSHKKSHRQKITKNLISHFHKEGLTNVNISRVINALQGNPDNPEDDLSPQQVHSHLRVERKNNMGKHCAKVIRHFIEKKAKDPHSYSSIEVDDDMTLRSVFWADGRSREAYKQFHNVIVFDVTYRTNNLCLPFAPFTGINHHRQSCLLGCALLADETEKTFVWLFQQYLECMGGEAPGAIITDQDAAIGNVIAIVFPTTTVHRYCDWNLDKNIGEHMVSLKAVHGPGFELYFNRLRTSRSEGEAESTWKELMTRYKLENNSWLPRLWVHRAHWVHCYFIDTFFAGTRTSQRSESINAFFDKFVHASTPLHEFVLQYDKALASRRKAEEDEDFKSMESKPVPISGWPLEVQTGRCYTRALFSLFKKEMSDAKQLYWADRGRKEGDVTIFSVERVGANESTCRNVSYNSVRGVVSCSCKHFEFVGLLCRHVLCVFWMNRVSEIPERYILKRWTLEARYRSVVVDMSDDVRVSEVDRNRHLGIWYKCNKAADLAYKSPNFDEELDRYLTRKFAEYEKPEIPERVDEPSQASNNQFEPSHLTPLINIRDPTGPSRHKGRPRLPSRTKSGLEESQEESAKKKRKCGYCGEMGHYRTGCSKAKADNVANVDEDGS